MKIEPDILFTAFENPFLFFKNSAITEVNSESTIPHNVEHIKDVSPKRINEKAP